MSKKNYLKDRPGAKNYNWTWDFIRISVPITLFVIGWFIAANVFARDINYNPTITGPALVVVFGKPIYNPVYYILALFIYMKEAWARPLFLKSIMWVLWIGILALVFAIVWTIITDLLFKGKRNLHGTARFATKKDLKENGLLKEEGVICGQLANAVVLANKEKNSSISMKLVRPSQLICHGGTVNTLLLAPTGSGKGVSVIIPTILSYPHSMIIFDPKGENYNLTAGYRKTFSRVLKFAPCSYDTLRFNPVMAIRDGDEYAFRDASLIASIIFAPSKVGGGGDEASEYFSIMAKDLVTGSLLHIRFGDYPDKSLAGLLHFLTDVDEKSFEKQSGEANNEIGKKQCMEMLHTKHYFRITEQMYNNRPSYYEEMTVDGKKGREWIERDSSGKIIRNDLIGRTIPAKDPDEKIKLSAQSSLSQNAKEKGSTYATVRAKLNLFNDPTLAAATSGTDFEIEDFITSDDPISLYLTVPYSDVTRISPVFRLLISFMLKKFSEGETQFGEVKLKHNILFLLDEFPILGCFPDIAEVMGVLRGYGIFFLIVCQALSQLIDRYGQNQPFLDHCPVHIVFAPGSINDAEMYSRSIGQESISEGKVSRSGRTNLTVNTNLNYSDNNFGRNLLDAADIKRLDGDKALIMVHGMQPYIAEKVVYYMDKRFTSRYMPYKGKAPGIKELYGECSGLPSVRRRLALEKAAIKKEMEMSSVCNDRNIDGDENLFENEDGINALEALASAIRQKEENDYE